MCVRAFSSETELGPVDQNTKAFLLGQCFDQVATVLQRVSWI